MIHWNTELRKHLRNEGKSPFRIALTMLNKYEQYSAATMKEFLDEKHAIQPPSLYSGMCVGGPWAYIEFPSLKYERKNSNAAVLSDPTGSLEVTMEYLWENSGIVPANIPDGMRIMRPVVAYNPKKDRAALYRFDDRRHVASNGQELADLFREYARTLAIQPQ